MHLLRSFAETPVVKPCFGCPSIDTVKAVPRTEVLTSAGNSTDQPLTLEFLSSFSLGGITPFAADDAAQRLRVHRFRSQQHGEIHQQLALGADGAQILLAAPGDHVVKYGIERKLILSRPTRNQFSDVGAVTPDEH